MDEVQSLVQGFVVALSFKNLALMFVGIVLGVIIGVLPGLGGANGVAILLPLTFSMAQAPGGTTSAIILLSCIYWGAREQDEDRKSTRLNSSHLGISYAVFCLKKKKK